VAARPTRTAGLPPGLQSPKRSLACRESIGRRPLRRDEVLAKDRSSPPLVICVANTIRMSRAVCETRRIWRRLNTDSRLCDNRRRAWLKMSKRMCGPACGRADEVKKYRFTDVEDRLGHRRTSKAEPTLHGVCNRLPSRIIVQSLRFLEHGLVRENDRRGHSGVERTR
jgi:hypothetical protein